MMAQMRSILVVSSRSEADPSLLEKAARVARSLGMGLELLLCDPEQAYALKHSYESSGSHRERALRESLARDTERRLRRKDAGGFDDIPFVVDATCESPLYETVLRKALKTRPRLVIKSAGDGRPSHSAFDANDWQLMRTCPSTLALVRGRRWREKLRIAAAIDVSEEETEGLAGTILGVAKAFAMAAEAELDVVYAERSALDADSSRARASKLHELARQSAIQDDRVYILAGDPERELSRFCAGRDYDVMVLGALAHRPGTVSLVGTLTSVLVERLQCDFVLVKPSAYCYELGSYAR